MPEHSINWLAILVSGVVYTVLGALWYTPALFGKAWMQGIGKSREQVNQDFSPLNIVWALIFSWIAAYGIARVMYWAGFGTVIEGFMVGVLAGVCFVGATFVINDVFEKRPRSLTAINILYHLIAFAVVGAIIGAW